MHVSQKAEAALLKEKAELCESREQAQVIIRKADKARRKIERAHVDS